MFHLPHLCTISFYISIYTYFINLLESNQVNVCVLWFLHVVLYCVIVLLQMSCCSSQGKDIVIDVPSFPVSKRTCRSTQDSNSERFRTPLNSHTHSSIFQNAPTVVEQVIKFDSLRTTFILRIFEAKDWADLFGNFEDPIDELVKEFYSSARYTGVLLKCWVREKEFSINLDYIAKVLRIIRLANVDITSYDDR